MKTRMSETKTCTRCNTRKPITAFKRRWGTNNSVYSWCITCKRAYDRAAARMKKLDARA